MKKQNVIKQDFKNKPVSQMIDFLIEKFQNKKRIKKGEVITSMSNAKEYKILKKSLNNFTTAKYGMRLYRVNFGDIDKDFINNYILYIQK